MIYVIIICEDVVIDIYLLGTNCMERLDRNSKDKIGILGTCDISDIRKWNFYELRWKIRDIYWTKIIQRRIFQKFLKREPVMPHYAGKKVMGCEKTNKLIVSMIESGKPFMVSRFGNTELQNLISQLKNYYFGENDNTIAFEEKWMSNLCELSGFFPKDKKLFTKFSYCLLQAAQKTDILGMWHCHMEDYIISKYMKNTKLSFISYLEPWNAKNPWTRALKGKKVLVIHPFEDSIRLQYSKREKLFENSDILPEFELKTLKAVQTLAGTRDDRFNDWFEALDYMFKEAMKIDFDVAIIGCGAYGMPLAAMLKDAGKQAIHLGGVTQILFGIRGRRWDEYSCFKVKFNEEWVYPMESERPLGSQKVEDSCYWK